METQPSDPSLDEPIVLRDDSTTIEVHLIPYGATITQLLVPDRAGNVKDVLLGCPKSEDYRKPHPFFNCLVGRYANRITAAKFTLEGKQYQLDANMGKHHIHGGKASFAYQNWQHTLIPYGVEFSFISEDGASGYPGELAVRATYTLQNAVLTLGVHATTTKTTPLSTTAHHYFNLSGRQASSIRDHLLRINADTYCPAADDLTQLGLTESVQGTPFDFRESKPVGGPQTLDANHPQVVLAGGFDHNYVLAGTGLRTAAILSDPDSGRVLTVATNQPCMQLYTANTLLGKGKEGVEYSKHQGICLETQQYPDSVNQANYPTSLLEPGEHFHAITQYAFSISDSF